MTKQSKIKYGDKRDFPKIDIYFMGSYQCSTTWARTLKQAKESFMNKSGLKDKSIVKAKKTCTVTDQLTVTNSKCEIVKTYYHSTHEFCGQLVTNTEVCDTTIAMGISPEKLKNFFGGQHE